jgi:hypothetical protein
VCSSDLVAVALIPLLTLGGFPGPVMFRPMVWQSGYVAYLGGLAVLLYFALARSDRSWLPIPTMVVPSLTCAVTVAYTSYINVGVSGQAFLPALVVTMVYGTWIIRGRGPAALYGPKCRYVEPAWWRGWLAVAVVGSLCVAMGVLQWQAVFQDDPPAALTATVSGGPWDGLRTTPERRDYVETLVDDLQSVTTRESRVFVYTWCPGVYLAAQGRIATPMMSAGGSAALRTELVERFESAPPDIIVEDRYYWWTQSPFDPIRRFVTDMGYRPRILERDFTIYEKRAGP